MSFKEYSSVRSRARTLIVSTVVMLASPSVARADYCLGVLARIVETRKAICRLRAAKNNNEWRHAMETIEALGEKIGPAIPELLLAMKKAGAQRWVTRYSLEERVAKLLTRLYKQSLPHFGRIFETRWSYYRNIEPLLVRLTRANPEAAITRLREKNVAKRLLAIKLLVRVGLPQKAHRPLIALVNDKNAQVAYSALQAVGKLPPAKAVPVLSKVLADSRLRSSATRQLIAIGEPAKKQLPRILSYRRVSDPAVHGFVVKYGSEKMRRLLRAPASRAAAKEHLRLLEHGTLWQKRLAIYGLGSLRGKSDGWALAALLAAQQRTPALGVDVLIAIAMSVRAVGLDGKPAASSGILLSAAERKRFVASIAPFLVSKSRTETIWALHALIAIGGQEAANALLAPTVRAGKASGFRALGDIVRRGPAKAALAFIRRVFAGSGSRVGVRLTNFCPKALRLKLRREIGKALLDAKTTRDALGLLNGLGPKAHLWVRPLSLLVTRGKERQRAADALKEIGPHARAAVGALLRAYKRSARRYTREAILAALASVGPRDRRVNQLVLTALGSSRSYQRRTAIGLLGFLSGRQAMRELDHLLRRKSFTYGERRALVVALQRLKKRAKGVRSALVALIKNRSAPSQLRRAALGALLSLKGRRTLQLAETIIAKKYFSEYYAYRALGKLGAAALPLIAKLLASDKTHNRRYLIEAIQKIGKPARALRYQLVQIDDWQARKALKAIGEAPLAKALDRTYQAEGPEILGWLARHDKALDWLALRALSHKHVAGAAAALERLHRSADPALRAAVAKALRRSRHAEAADWLEKLLRDTSVAVRVAALGAVFAHARTSKGSRLLSLAASALKHPNKQLRWAAISALSQSHPRSRAALIGALTHSDAHVVKVALGALTRQPKSDLVLPLSTLVMSGQHPLQAPAALAILREVDDRRAVALLRKIVSANANKPPLNAPRLLAVAMGFFREHPDKLAFGARQALQQRARMIVEKKSSDHALIREAILWQKPPKKIDARLARALADIVIAQSASYRKDVAKVAARVLAMHENVAKAGVTKLLDCYEKSSCRKTIKYPPTFFTALTELAAVDSKRIVKVLVSSLRSGVVYQQMARVLAKMPVKTLQPKAADFVWLLKSDDRSRQKVALFVLARLPEVVEKHADRIEYLARSASRHTVRRLAQKTLQRVLPKRWLRLTWSKDAQVPKAALDWLKLRGASHGLHLRDRLTRAVSKKGPLRPAAIDVLGKMGSARQSVSALVAAADADDRKTRQAAIEALDRYGAVVTQHARRALGDASSPNRRQAVMYLAQLKDLRSRHRVVRLLAKDSSLAVRCQAAKALGELPSSTNSHEALMSALKQKNLGVRKCAAMALLNQGQTQPAVRAMLPLLDHADGTVRSRALDVLTSAGAVVKGALPAMRKQLSRESNHLLKARLAKLVRDLEAI